jgi:hypothetical protein
VSTVGQTLSVPLGKRAWAALTTGKMFRIGIIAATILPLVVAVGIALLEVVSTHGPSPVSGFFQFGSVSLKAVLSIMATLSSAHVMSTGYLLFNPKECRGVWRPGLSLVAIPAVLFGATFFTLLALPLWAVLAYMLAYLHYGMFHFGRQNLGVLSFVSRIALHRPITPVERWTIMAGVIAGIFATYSIFAPALGLNPKVFPFDVSRIEPIFSSLWYVGAAINLGLVPFTLFYAFAHRREYDWSTLTAWLASVFFFLPMFLTSTPLFALIAWTVAHGLQYVVFLFFHAAGKRKPAMPLIFLGAAVGAGVIIWRLSAIVQTSDAEGPVRVAVATITAITLVHYWVDQFLWKFSTPERRKWFSENYSFLFE